MLYKVLNDNRVMILTTNLYCTCRREILSTNLGAVGDNWPLSIKAYLCVLTTMVVIVYSLVAVNCRILLTVDHTISMTLRSCMRFSVSVLTALVARFLRIQAGYLLGYPPIPYGCLYPLVHIVH